MKTTFAIFLTLATAVVARSEKAQLFVHRPEINGSMNAVLPNLVFDGVDEKTLKNTMLHVSSPSLEGGDFRIWSIESGAYDVRVESHEIVGDREVVITSKWERIFVQPGAKRYFIIDRKTSEGGYLREWEIRELPQAADWKKAPNQSLEPTASGRGSS